MDKTFLVVHTPGTFGSFLAWSIDCYKEKKILQSPFLASGNSHGHNIENEKQIGTISWDIILPQLRRKYDQNDTDGAHIIGIHWDQKWFPYLLHAGIDRTNNGQYGVSGVAFAEKNFHEFMEKHTALLEDGTVWMKSYKPRLLEHFDFDCNHENPTVPRLVLRNLFWLNMATEKKHIVTETNQAIKSSNHDKIDIETILDYKSFNKYLHDLFGYKLDFSEMHQQFLDKNNSLKEYQTMRRTIDSVKNGTAYDIPKMSVIGECVVMYELEKHFFDVNFFNVPFYFKNTSDITEYVKHYPKHMKNPNKFFQTHWKDFS